MKWRFFHLFVVGEMHSTGEDGVQPSARSLEAETYAVVTREALCAHDWMEKVRAEEMGGLCTFLGVVRRHNEGKEVLAVDYQAYEPMALQELERIRLEIRSATDANIALAHRLGRLVVGDVSLVVATASIHREEAFRACREAVEAVKHRLPVWKQEFYTDGTSHFLEGCSSLSPREF